MGGMTGLLLLLWAGVTVGSLVDLQKRIIGGGNCTAGHREYHVVLKDPKGSCGGSLISDQWVLTAAHCWEGRGWTMTAMLGRSRATIMNITEHHIYKKGFLGKKHDLMLLKLPEKITDITPVKLPNCTDHLNIGDAVEIAGHGPTTLRHDKIRVGGTSKTLQCANTDVVDCDELRQCLKNDDPEFLKSRKHEEWLCFKRDNVDASPGDSGGGVVFNNMIYGVISFTGNETHACVEAAGSMNVCHEDYLKWIKDTIKPKESCVGCFG